MHFVYAVRWCVLSLYSPSEGNRNYETGGQNASKRITEVLM
jgi:hypothetical protein